MKIETYKGFELQIMEVETNPNGCESQTVLIYKNENPISATFADIKLEDAIQKAKIKIDNKLNN